MFVMVFVVETNRIIVFATVSIVFLFGCFFFFQQGVLLTNFN